MGEAILSLDSGHDVRSAFIGHLLHDIEALERMLALGMLETGITRIGAEQEFCLLNTHWRPSRKAPDLLPALADPHFTTELARYNLEINLDPLTLEGQCFSRMEQQLTAHLQLAQAVAAQVEDRVLLTGILPTITKNELGLDFMTPLPRYRALNNATRTLRGKDFELRIRGLDELSIIHDSVLFEACNTSFQLHLQIAPEDFIASYNWAQALSGPLLAVCTNSPLLLGRELWSETRIALFQQSIDTRRSSYALRHQRPRVSFGTDWARGSIADIFKDDIAGHPVLLFKPIDTHSLEELERGQTPRLPALALHNSTIYRWNRACYGVGGGKPHLRIENRYLPAGPSVQDEIANFAFWVGMMVGRPPAFDELATRMDFRDVKANFIKAAQTGKESVMLWEHEPIPAQELVLKQLLPLAHAGLQKAGIQAADSERYLGIIEKRTAGATGAQWAVRNFRTLQKTHKKDDALTMLTKAMYKNQQTGRPVHDWPPVDPELEAHEAACLVGHIMSTELFTVKDHDLADLATSVMRWKGIHHVPVENATGELCGLLTWTHLQRHQARNGDTGQCLVGDIMARDLITVRTETSIKTAIALMKRNTIGCLPVVQDRCLVGILTIKDVLPYDHG
ncbi:putative manganese-dependent inorganic pyrophosphatase [Cesiribacter andamanensis AMV16]|uniref:Putative manganese-dependent inorganic pyrophosphatase n=1 Tax=Cesiribacter andamanensis AMV16 TaxID=1279009 RepID=M7NI64_9BACT|nr:CBS domain-containing protein [Cesiribacter andamanensis]EMR01495.1 putative manganese-dependent inorganic pyrophosphatase [Cesiribacter andamanensis AMV16]